MEKSINEKVLRFVGSASLPLDTEMELGDDKKVNLDGAVINVVRKDNQDGTQNIEYVVKIITAGIVR
jgi:hypothetical protein